MNTLYCLFYDTQAYDNTEGLYEQSSATCWETQGLFLKICCSSEHTVRGKQLCLQSMLFCSTRMHCSYRVIILGK